MKASSSRRLSPSLPELETRQLPNVRLENFNAYCFRHLGFSFRHIQVSAEYDKGDDRIDVGAQVGVGGGENTDTENDPEGFYIAFFR